MSQRPWPRSPESLGVLAPQLALSDGNVIDPGAGAVGAVGGAADVEGNAGLSNGFGRKGIGGPLAPIGALLLKSGAIGVRGEPGGATGKGAGPGAATGAAAAGAAGGAAGAGLPPNRLPQFAAVISSGLWLVPDVMPEISEYLSSPGPTKPADEPAGGTAKFPPDEPGAVAEVGCASAAETLAGAELLLIESTAGAEEATVGTVACSSVFVFVNEATPPG